MPSLSLKWDQPAFSLWHERSQPHEKRARSRREASPLDVHVRPRRPLQRHPLSKEERAEAEKILASSAASSRVDVQQSTQSAEEAGGACDAGDLIEPSDFLRVLDAWVDSKYSGDRGSATKVKVAFRKVSPSTGGDDPSTESETLGHHGFDGRRGD